jgi:hypothetical protein
VGRGVGVNINIEQGHHGTHPLPVVTPPGAGVRISGFTDNQTNYNNKQPSSNKKRRSQQRAATRRKQQERIQQQDAFKHKADTFLTSVQPSVAELLTHSNQDPTAERQRLQKELRISAEALHKAQEEEEHIVQSMVENWLNGGVGYVPLDKEDDTIRCFGENFNSLHWFEPKHNKCHRATKLIHKYGLDMFSGMECQVQWDMCNGTCAILMKATLRQK